MSRAPPLPPRHLLPPARGAALGRSWTSTNKGTDQPYAVQRLAYEAFESRNFLGEALRLLDAQNGYQGGGGKAAELCETIKANLVRRDPQP